MDHGPRLSEAFTPRKQKRSACRSISFWTWWATGSRNAAKDQNIFGESESGVAGVQEPANYLLFRGSGHQARKVIAFSSNGKTRRRRSSLYASASSSFRSLTESNLSWPFFTSTVTRLFSAIVPARICRDNAVSRWRCKKRFSGRAPYTGS